MRFSQRGHTKLSKLHRKFILIMLKLFVVSINFQSHYNNTEDLVWGFILDNEGLQWPSVAHKVVTTPAALF